MIASISDPERLESLIDLSFPFLIHFFACNPPHKEFNFLSSQEANNEIKRSSAKKFRRY